QAVLIVDQFIRSAVHVNGAVDHDSLWPETAHVEPHRRRTRSSVIQESNRTVFLLTDSFFYIGRKRHLGGGVDFVFGQNRQGSGNGFIIDGLSRNAYTSRRGDRGFDVGDDVFLLIRTFSFFGSVVLGVEERESDKKTT